MNNSPSYRHLISLATLQAQANKRNASRSIAQPHEIQPSARPVVEITVGASPGQLIEQLLDAVPSDPLREFLRAVVIEPEVKLALTTPVRRPVAFKGRVPSFQSYPVQFLRRAAEMAGYWCAYGQEERAVLFVATVIRGIQSLLSDYVVGPANLEDVMFTLVRPALHRLDDSAPRQACLLRLSLGWGNADEVDACYVPRLQESVARALRAVAIGQPTHHNTRLC